MQILGPEMPFYVLAALWIVRTIVLVFICSLLALLGIRLIDVLIPKIPKRERVGENPISIGLLIGGYFIFVGLVIHGALTMPAVVGAPLIESIIDPRRLGLMAAYFLVSVFLAVALFYIMDRLTPRIPFLEIDKNPIAVGICVSSYFIFFGLVIHAVLLTPL